MSQEYRGLIEYVRSYVALVTEENDGDAPGAAKVGQLIAALEAVQQERDCYREALRLIASGDADPTHARIVSDAFREAES